MMKQNTEIPRLPQKMLSQVFYSFIRKNWLHSI